MRRWLLIAGAWLLCAGASAAGPDVLDACAVQAAPESRGLVVLEAACPGLEAALHDTGVATNLPDGWRESLHPDALRDIVTLGQRYLQPPSLAPDDAGLGAILQQLASEQVRPEQSWWDMAKAWLRSWFSTQGESSGSWLDQLLERLNESRNLIVVMTYVLLAIAVIAAVAFIVNELRIAGVLTRRRSHQSGSALSGAPAQTPVTGLGDLESAALADQPAILLRLLVAQLAARGILTTDRSLTHRELVARAALPDPDSRGRFARVSQLAERVLYGHGADVGQMRDVVVDGRSLLLQLQAAGDARR